MNDKQFKEQRRRVRKLWTKWQDVLGLYAWDVTLNYFRGAIDVDGAINFDAAGCAKVSWEYQRATLSFDLEAVMAMDDRVLEEMIVHECTHILLRQMRQDWFTSPSDLNMPHEEHVATMISRAFLDVRKAGAA